ncbi:hypothetical protein [Spiroplasma melliferum]|uniref:Uncharacterized protein n=2 Tax=Spiroplasma melliferum TaxID=2134 RepID=A0AAI9X0K0_SPIME|nr:hypothetical protein [Spiroplasma melliferum]KAI92005.1 hypothetical protein SPM_006715 [Spiroplasma melliferum KC3]KDN02044.1 hypothetical protein BK60_14175 [Neisseria gonorrhoeae]QCO23230.1 hypothetical protein SRED_003092 [Spiroplasma melliferum]QCO23244.1 hypothetical protein SRED_003106 [Spiroplasma melliferum]
MNNKLLASLKNKIDSSASQIPKEESFNEIKKEIIYSEIKDETKIVRKNISITLKQQKMINEMSKNNYEINLSSIARREIEKIYNEFKLKK